MLERAQIQSFFRPGTIIPILKGKSFDPTKSDNSRAITISSLFGKLLDVLLLNRYTDLLHTSDMQFGFKPKHSTDQCTFVLKQAIHYYITNDTNVFSALLDLKKAFDSVDMLLLFRKLRQRNLPPS